MKIILLLAVLLKGLTYLMLNVKFVTLNQVLDILCENEGIAIQREEMGEKVVELRELQRAII
jgi:hypothetical protein